MNADSALAVADLNSVFQVLAFGLLGWFYLQVLPGWLGLPAAHLTACSLPHTQPGGGPGLPAKDAS